MVGKFSLNIVDVTFAIGPTDTNRFVLPGNRAFGVVGQRTANSGFVRHPFADPKTANANVVRCIDGY